MAVYGYVFLAVDREELVPLDQQRRELKECAVKLGGSIDDLYVEQRASLKSAFKKREVGRALFQHVQAGDTIIVMQSRWILGGGAKEAARLVRMLRKAGVSLYCADLETSITLDEKRRLAVYEGGAGLLGKLLHALATCEASEHGKAIRATKKIRKEQGKYLGGPVPFGWKVGSRGFLVQNPEQQKIIRIIQKMRENRWSFREISKELRMKYDVRLSHEGVRRILKSTEKREKEKSEKRSGADTFPAP
jgi:DNA invertase Pin-like site-specific DNA recombinase